MTGIVSVFVPAVTVLAPVPSLTAVKTPSEVMVPMSPVTAKVKQLFWLMRLM